MANDRSIEARSAAVFELYAAHEEDLSHEEIRQSFFTLHDIARDAILEMGDAFGLRGNLEFYVDALVQTAVFLTQMAAEETRQ